MAKLVPPLVAKGALSDSVQPELEVDDELRLRPWRQRDASAVLEAYSSPDIQRYHFRRHDTEDDAVEWIANEIDGWNTERSASWAWVMPNARGRGVATRACIAAAEWAHELGLHRVVLYSHLATDEL